MARFIYSTVVTAVLVACYFAVLAVIGVDITNEVKAVGVALWFIAFHTAGTEFQFIEFSEHLFGRPKKDDPPPPSSPAI